MQWGGTNKRGLVYVENDELKTMLEDRDVQLGSSKEEVVALKNKLETAENEMLNHVKKAKTAHDKIEIYRNA